MLLLFILACVSYRIIIWDRLTAMNTLTLFTHLLLLFSFTRFILTNSFYSLYTHSLLLLTYSFYSLIPFTHLLLLFLLTYSFYSHLLALFIYSLYTHELFLFALLTPSFYSFYSLIPFTHLLTLFTHLLLLLSFARFILIPFTLTYS